MASGDLILDSWSMELRGVLMEAVRATGDFHIIAWPDGLGVPDSRLDTIPIPSEHGVFPGVQYLNGRTITMSLGVRGDTAEAVETAAQTLAGAWAPVSAADSDNVIPLIFRMESSRKYRMYGKPLRMATAWGVLLEGYAATDTWLTAEAQFLATDPRVYDNTLSSDTATVGTTSGGLSFPFGHPYGFGSAAPGTILADNEGNFPTYPVFTISSNAGTLTTPIIINNVTTGESFRVDLSLAENEVLIIDMANKDVYLDSGASRLDNVDWTVSEWFDLESGVNEVTWSIGAGSTPTILAEWRSAWVF